MQVEQPPVTLKEHLFPTICAECEQPFMSDLEKFCETCLLIKSCKEFSISEKIWISYCRFCEAYKGKEWTYCEIGSLEFMEIMMKEIRCSEKVKILSVSSQKNSSCIELKGKIERQLPESIRNIHNFKIDCFLQESECEECEKLKYLDNFKAVVEIKQESDHQKTFFYLEQLLIKYQKYKKIMKVQIHDVGINFYYQNSLHAKELISFLSDNLPVSISYQKNVFDIKKKKQFDVFQVQIPNIKRNDLLYLPIKLSKELGCSSLVICTSVKEKIYLMDSENFKNLTISSIQYEYYKAKIEVISFAKHSQEFTILSSSLNRKNHKSILPKLFNYEISHQEHWQSFTVQGNLGYIPAGKIVKGFDLSVLIEKEELTPIKSNQSIILVEKRKKKSEKRVFILKRLKDFGILLVNGKTNEELQKYCNEFEDFLDEIEVSSILRQEMKLFKNQEVSTLEAEKNRGEIELCELLEELNLEEKENNVLNEELEGINDLIKNFDKFYL